MAETDTYALPVGYVLTGRGDTYTLVDRGDGSAVLGQGGFGITYLALSRKFAEQVAVKELYVSTDNICRRTHASLIAIDKPKAFAALKQAFIKEAKTLAMFRAEHRIVDVLDIFEANNTQYLVMPYLKGKHFGELAKLETFDEARVRDLIVQLATGLKKVHDKGLLHRDIKPDNIKLSEDGTYPILIDFGSSKEIESTRSRYLAFADGFSPWELYVTSRKKTPATDVYSLAATAYFLLLGETPPPATQRCDDWDAHNRDPENVPGPVLATLNQAVASGKVSPQFGRALDTALAFHDQDRFQSLDAFVEAIVPDQADPIPNRADPIPEEPDRRKKRPPTPSLRLTQLLAGVALVMALAVGLNLYLTQVSSGADRAAWNLAQQVDTQASYLGYLDQYPDGRWAQMARAQIDEIEETAVWEAAMAGDSRASYQIYLDTYADGEWAQEARSRIAELAEEAISTEIEITEELSGTDLKMIAGRFERENLPEMVAIPAGSFWMGGPPPEGSEDQENPWRRRIELEGFYLSSTEITFGMWDACVRDQGCSHNPSGRGWGRGDRPVMNVSWEDAQEFVAWVNANTDGGYSLPSEAQWEYAARAGTTTAFSTGDQITTEQANFKGSDTYIGSSVGIYREQTVPVGSFEPNAWGLYDMHGNVWEWTQDCWNKDLSDHPSNGAALESGDCEQRVRRGGSWVNGPYLLRSAIRVRSTSSKRDSGFGFRLLKTL